MNRLFAYLGPATPLAALLPLGPTEGGGGGGLECLWLARDGAPAGWRTPLAAAAEPNLADLGRALASPQWLGLALDAGEAGESFHRQGQMFAATAGGPCPAPLRNALVRHLNPATEARLSRFTLGEYLFVLTRQLLEEDEELSQEEALVEGLGIIGRAAGELPLDLNLTLADGERIYLVRHAFNAPCAPLHYSADDENFPDAQVAATRVPRDSEFWLPIPEHHLLLFDPDEPPELMAL